jgi:hypothetical protein
MGILGKVAGSMLKDNLVRNGVDLILDSNLMYWDVANRRVGINTTMPGNTFVANGDATLSNIYFTHSNIYSLSGNLVLDSITGNIEVNAKQVKNVRDPTEDQDAATKHYVDRLSQITQNLHLLISDSINNTTNVYIATETLTVLGTENQINAYVTSNDTITFSLTENVNINGNLVSGNLSTFIANVDSIIANSIQSAAIGNVAPGSGDFTTLTTTSTIIANGNIVANSTTDSISLTTGSIIAAGGVGITGNV